MPASRKGSMARSGEAAGTISRPPSTMLGGPSGAAGERSPAEISGCAGTGVTRICRMCGLRPLSRAASRKTRKTAGTVLP